MAIAIACDAHEPEVDVGRGRPVELELTRQCGLSLREGREIQVGQSYVLLDFVGLLSREEDARGVGLDHLHLPGLPRIRRGVGQERDDLRLARRDYFSALPSYGASPFVGPFVNEYVRQ